MKGKLYLVPAPLGGAPEEVIPSYVFGQISHITHFVVEELRTARRYLSSIGFKGRIEGLNFYEINEHTTFQDAEQIIKVLLTGEDMALISEAGLPAVADPGANLVDLAHRHDVDVIPFVGPSSLMMALMSSGMNGQSFAFNGYLPVKPHERKAKIKELEKRSRNGRQSQIFIETPYRNDAMLADILEVCEASTRVCIAADITLPSAYIKTRRVQDWKQNRVTIGKRPCVFILMA
ncbi:MAG: SAM-dependent methyltransferase [Bacteroidales bacterium]|nr:SAM-dependent methyltransferase [Bacteroidales bacterium]